MAAICWGGASSLEGYLVAHASFFPLLSIWEGSGSQVKMEEGMLVGISSGATLAAIAQKLPELPANAVVLGFNYDTGERYLSVDGFLPA